jgi:peptidylprolyl isomerase
MVQAKEKGKPMAQAKQGDTVRVHYHGTLEDGTVFSSTYEEKEPFEFTIGKQSVLPRFEEAVIGMNAGETRSISVPPEDAYGQHKKEFVFVMDKAQAPVDLNLEVGKRLQVRSNQGKPTIATITAITEDSVILDANDPLAGKTLKFQIELIEIL